MRHGLCFRQAAAGFARWPLHPIAPLPSTANTLHSTPPDTAPTTPSAELRNSGQGPHHETSQVFPRHNYFRRLQLLLDDPRTKNSSSLSTRLDAVDPPAFLDHSISWPRDAILGALTGPAEQSSLIRFLPIVVRYMEESDVNQGAEVARRMLRRIKAVRALPLVTVIMDTMLVRLGRAVEDKEVETDDAMATVAVLLRSLQTFRQFSAIPDGKKKALSNHLPPSVNSEILRLASFAIDLAQSSPSSSSSPSLISTDVRQQLFSRVVWTPEMRRLLLSHIPGQQLSPGELRLCGYSVISEGGEGSSERAMRFTALAQKADQEAARGMRRKEARVAHGVKELADARSALEAVDQITLARCGATAQAVIHSLEPFLDIPPAPDEGDTFEPSLFPSRPYAWSILANRLSRSPHTSTDDLLDIAEALTEDLTIPHIMTPIISGLAARGDREQAWEMFTDLSDRQRAPGAPPGRFVDRQLLAAVTPLCAELHGPSAAILLIDGWARRPTSMLTSSWRRSITIDSFNLNALLTQYIRAGRPSVALRLMAAAQPRWGVWPDHISLNILLDCCRLSRRTETDEPDTVRSRLRHLVGAISIFTPHPSPWTSEPMSFDVAKLAKHDHRVLLDPDGPTWQQMMGNMRPWQYARRIFQDVIFGNWPHLVNIHSPLEFGAFARLEDILLPYDPPDPGELRHPLPTAKYTHLIPNAVSFHSYINLLGFFNLAEEIPTALSWARELGIEPNWRSMCSALAFVGEVEGPRRRVRGWYENGGSAFVRDEDILRRWLEEWVKGPVASETEVAQFVKKIRDRGGRMSAASRWGNDQ